tara:strand:+ start:142 stop:285 length:144 start_codon:yes stop_codon:yes gene_type:complete
MTELPTVELLDTEIKEKAPITTTTKTIIVKTAWPLFSILRRTVSISI